jgi:hypothetical protein
MFSVDVVEVVEAETFCGGGNLLCARFNANTSLSDSGKVAMLSTSSSEKYI